jgi:NADH:ubiquinone oxidoreductase subunit F (NADH-binding)
MSAVTLDRAAVPAHPGVEVETGPVLLAALSRGGGLQAHRSARGDLPEAGPDDLERVAAEIGLEGRGGAGFPFADKLRAVRRRTRHRVPVVVNVCEGEPMSAKDSALAVVAPHLVLDGAVMAAKALRSCTVHVAVPAERPGVGLALANAIRERDRGDDSVTFQLHLASPGFVSGQSRAVVELIEGRNNTPVTATKPVTASGVGGRPTLLSNAETYAQLAAALLQLPPGAARYLRTTLLTVVDGVDRSRVLEVPIGASWSSVLPPWAVEGPVLLGGYHGRWAAPGALTRLSVSRSGLASRGLVLGAGVVLVPRGCPVVMAARITDYLAGQSAGLCGPCRLGLPTLAHLVRGLVAGTSDPDEVRRVASMVAGRGACAHPDGTSTMVASALEVLHDEIQRHARGACTDDDRFSTDGT